MLYEMFLSLPYASPKMPCGKSLVDRFVIFPLVLAPGSQCSPTAKLGLEGSGKIQTILCNNREVLHKGTGLDRILCVLPTFTFPTRALEPRSKLGPH